MKRHYLLLLSLLIAVTFGFKINHLFKPDLSQNIQQSTATCNYTQIAYQNIDFISKNTYMAGALNRLPQSLQKTQYQATDDDRYETSQPVVSFQYNGSNQKASFGQNDIILIEGGYINVNLTVYWNKFTDQTYVNSGKLTAVGTTREMPFSFRPKTILQEGLNISHYRLYQYMNFTMMGDFLITGLSCDKAQCTDQDLKAMMYLVNKLDSFSVKSILQRTVNQNLRNALMQAVGYRGNDWTRSQFMWENINIYRPDTLIWVDKTSKYPGVYYTYYTQIWGFNGTCGPAPNTSAILDPKVYGGSQEFNSFTFYENMVRLGLQYKVLDANLTRTTWSTKSFRFWAGELQNVFSNISQTFAPDTDVKGWCSGQTQNLKIYQATNKTFNVDFFTKCNITIKNTKIVDFTVLMTLQVMGIVHNDTLDFWVSSYKTPQTTYNDSYGFKLLDKKTADKMVYDGLERLSEHELFGSDWPIYTERNTSYFMVTENVIGLTELVPKGEEQLSDN